MSKEFCKKAKTCKIYRLCYTMYSCIKMKHEQHAALNIAKTAI